MTIKAIETKYSGYRFRSRLEARWAVFLEALGLRWEYEKEGFSFDGYSYLPDFYLPDYDLYIEVKGQDIHDTTEEDKLRAFAWHANKPVFVVCGLPEPVGKFYYYSTRRGTYTICDCAKYGHSPYDGPHEPQPGLFNVQMTISRALAEAFLEKLGVDIDAFIVHVEFPKMLMENERAGKGDYNSFPYERARCARFEHGETPE